jgi:hypothetical protein
MLAIKYVYVYRLKTSQWKGVTSFIAMEKNLKAYIKKASNSSLGIFSLILYYAILCSLHIK